jgi:hypothetical protein
VICFVTSYSLVDGFKLFGGKYCFHITVKKGENYLAETSDTYHKNGIIIRKNLSTNIVKSVYKLQGHYFIWQLTSHFPRFRVTADSGAPVAESSFFFFASRCLGVSVRFIAVNISLLTVF